VLDAEPRQGPADVRETVAIDGAPSLGGVKRPAGPIGIQGHGQAEAPAHRGQGGHDRGGGFRRPELGVEQVLGGVVEDGDEGLALPRAQGQPFMGAAVEVQQLAEPGAGLPAPAVATAGAALAHQPGLLERQANEAVGQRHAVIPAEEVVEGAHVEAAVGVPIQAQDPRQLAHRHLARRGQLPAIVEPVALVGLIAGAPPPQAARLDAEDVGGLQPGEGATQGNLLTLHGLLHGGREPTDRHLLGYRWLYPSSPVQRTFHLLSGADR
jgi:hypothetical protein